MKLKLNKLNIISLDKPYPPDYGGVIDIYYRILSLKELGIKICLHSFYEVSDDNHREIPHIENYFYPRKTGIQGLAFRTPYIVHSRRSEKLIDRVSSSKGPILFEGLHSCFYLDHPALKNRKKIVRLHNIEWDYYLQSSYSESIFWKKIYFKRESNLLKLFEAKLQNADLLLSISPKDFEYYQQTFSDIVKYLPVFHPHNEVNISKCKGEYALYHGNLQINENIQAALFLLNEVVPKTTIPWKIAGKNPGKEISAACLKQRVDLVENPSDELMTDLISNAQLNVIPSFQDTGIKLKLLNALYRGRFCIVNPPMIDQNGLGSLCSIATNASEFASKINDLADHEFSDYLISDRREILSKKFNNVLNAKHLIELIKQL